MTYIDVSAHNGSITWPRVRAAGVTCAIIRVATADRPDAAYTRNWREAKAAGIPRLGVYQYYVTEVAPLFQAQALLAITGGDFGTEPPTIDCERRADERAAPWSWEKRTAYTLNLRKWLIAMSEFRPRIYTSKWEWQAITTLPDWITDYSLWLAAYPGPPELPAKATAYTVHQYSSTGRVDGIAGNVDLNVEVGAPVPAPVAGWARDIGTLAEKIVELT